MTDQIHVLFSEEGEACAIRKWSKEPFYDAQTYVQKALLDTLAARVIELEAENKRLQKALKPLADAAETLIALDYQGNESTTLIGDVALFGYHFKDARVALKGGEV